MHECSHLSSEQLTCVSLGQINPGCLATRHLKRETCQSKTGPLVQLVEQAGSPPLPTFYLFNFTYFFILLSC